MQQFLDRKEREGKYTNVYVHVYTEKEAINK